MRALTSDHVGRWTRGAGIMALAALAWAAFVPGGLFWSVVVAVGLTGAVLVTVALVRSRSVPSLAQVIASAEAEPFAPFRGGASGAEVRRSPSSR